MFERFLDLASNLDSIIGFLENVVHDASVKVSPRDSLEHTEPPNAL